MDKNYMTKIFQNLTNRFGKNDLVRTNTKTIDDTMLQEVASKFTHKDAYAALESFRNSESAKESFPKELLNSMTFMFRPDGDYTTKTLKRDYYYQMDFDIGKYADILLDNSKHAIMVMYGIDHQPKHPTGYVGMVGGGPYKLGWLGVEAREYSGDTYPVADNPKSLAEHNVYYDAEGNRCATCMTGSCKMVGRIYRSGEIEPSLKF